MVVDMILATTAIVFLSEIGDKTMFTTLCMSAESGRPALILAISMAALTTASIVASALGFLLSSSLSSLWISAIAGASFLLIGVTQILKLDSVETTCDHVTGILGVYVTILSSELGDKSQLVILALSATFSSPVPVVLGAMLGFLLVNSVGSFVGFQMSERIPLRTIRLVAGVTFVVIGVLIVAAALLV